LIHIKKHSTDILIFLILLAAVGLRIIAYGNLRLSVGYTDTIGYIRSAESPLFSWKMFAGIRLFTTNLIYKFANDPINCPLIAVSKPSLGIEIGRLIQPCFDKIAVLQNILSILSWSFLAWTISRGLKRPALKVIGASLVVIFAFTPQIAEWDFILSPESLTFSLFAVAFSLSLIICCRIVQTANPFSSRSLHLLVAGWLVIFFFWVFIRDVHLYTIIPTILLILSILVFKDFRKNKIPILLSVVLCGIFLLGYKSAKDSLRATHNPLEHAFEAYIFPYQARLDYMKGFGMPDRESEEFQSWFDANATGTYSRFLISHPRFVLTTIWEQSPYFESDFEQPYFTTREVRWRDLLIKIGQFLHPETIAIYLIDLLILFALIVKAIEQREPPLLAWTWLAAWFFSCSFITLLPSFFGDTVGTRRHIFPSVEMFRLFLWIFLLVHLDRNGPSTLSRRDNELPA
jgi:hypothetical protein